MSDDVDKLDTSNAHDASPLTDTQRKFLKAYREVGIVKYACKVARISRQTFYNWRERDEAFKAELAHAVEDAHDTLEYAAYAQAVLGVEEYATNNSGVIEYNDKPVKIRKYAPSVLITLLKANMPEKYKDRQQHEHMGKDGGPVQVHVFLPD